ncbi:MAG: right-handed parallel beta-helix repeat-containing protein [Saprospiraceae bacterium]|nr:right-handed parallel beta-helix repeat-containing protein [Saprospiraceae bacterium]
MIPFDTSKTTACLLLFLFVVKVNTSANTTLVASQSEFNAAHASAQMNDSILWQAGIYDDIYMNITKSNLFIGTVELGATVFSGASRVRINGDYVTLEGVQFVDGDIGTNDVINTYGSYNHFNQINIRAYTCYKYLRIREECQYVDVTYCNFENRLNLADQNILSILVDENQPGYHKIQYCSFKNFDGGGNDDGIEPIRIGLSTQADHISRSLVEYCYFTQCNGDGELISSKATQNVYRFNTFEDNPKAELVLRHGSEAIVYGNFFINGKGGVRVREGQDHYIYNNYFYELDDRAIYLQNRDSDPLDNINIAFNTIVDCSEIILGGDGNYKPTRVTFANNIFAEPDDDLFEEPTGTETWIANLSFGDLGIPLPASGMTIVDPELAENSASFFGLAENSPAVDAAEAGFAPLPQFSGMVAIDTSIAFDLMGQERPANIEEKDLGCNEYPHNVLIQPIATEENTGPTYNTSTLSSVGGNRTVVDDLVQLSPNPTSQEVHIRLKAGITSDIQLELLDFQGKKIRTIRKLSHLSAPLSFTHQITDLSPGIYILHASGTDRKSGIQKIQSIKFSKQ